MNTTTAFAIVWAGGSLSFFLASKGSKRCKYCRAAARAYVVFDTLMAIATISILMLSLLSNTYSFNQIYSSVFSSLYEKTPHFSVLRYCGATDWRPTCVILALSAMGFALWQER